MISVLYWLNIESLNSRMHPAKGDQIQSVMSSEFSIFLFIITRSLWLI